MKGLLALILCIPVLLPAQNYLMNGSPITDCGGTFFDSGGPIFNYPNNQNLSTTICSDGSGGTHIRLSFTAANLGAGDMLCFYDGPTSGAPLLSCSSDYPAGQPFVVQATSNNPSGCITVTFQSNASGTGSGWSAAITCITACQNVLADLVSTMPAMVPADTGWIDICPGERVFFNGAGIYPQNNFAYPQSDLTTNFEWNFGDGGIAYGPNTSHRFDTPGGYYVQLLLRDTLGCHSSNFISQRVRVAQRPAFNLATLPQICAGDTLHLSASVDSTVTGTTVLVTPVSASFDVDASRSDSLALPDGTGALYETSIFFSEFSPGQVLTNANDLESICITMEHSWMRDMEITLTCPNGQSIILHDHPGNFGSEVFLGEPNDNDNFNPVPGLGYDYCWTPNAANPTWIVYANNILGGSGTLPPGDYSTFDPISDLIGCPLNGEWTIGVVDLWPADNGYIFNWSLKFQDALYPYIESFTPQFLTWNWSNHPSVYYSTTDSLSATPQNAGTAGYTFTVNDSFGCSWDTLVTVAVLPPTHPNCYVCATNFPVLPDTIVCVGDPVPFDATSLASPTQEVRFEAYPDYSFGNANHPHSNPYLSPIGVNSLGYNFLTNPIQQITSVCMDIESDFDADLNIFLQGPGGQQIMLSTGNGGAGDNYKITCFSPSATVPIVGQAAPFNGTYIPEGNWNVLAGAQVNGNWSLVVSDGFAPTQFGTVKWWSIGFNAQNAVTYNWTNTASLSCANCPTPIASPTDTTTYIMTAVDSYNCVHTDTAVVSVSTLFPAPTVLMVSQLGLGTMTWVWDAVPGALGYEVSVDGGPWLAPNNGQISHIVSGLAHGQMVNISVRCISPSCPPAVIVASDAIPPCTMFGNVFSSTDVPCAGDTTGSVVLSVSNAVSPVQFFLDNNPTAFPNGDLTNILSGGMHTVIIFDAIGCSDTLVFTINEPSAIALTASGTNVLCNGDNSGTLTASAIGGTGSIAFAWRDCLGGSTLGGAVQNNLFAGCYAVTATDVNGCTATSTVTLTEPLPYDFDLMQDSVSCSGLSDGSANIVVMGGLAPIQYLWDNGATTATATNLNAGFHFVTVTDINMCSATTFVQVFEPSVFLIDSSESQAATCFGGSNGTATVFAVGGTPGYSYLWDDPTAQTLQKALALSAGTYNVTVTDWNGCSAQTAVAVTSPPELLVNFTNVAAEKCAGDCLGQATVNPSGGVGAYQIDWQDNSIPDGTLTALNLCPGNYPLTVTDANACTAVSQVTINAALPIVVQLNGISPSCAGLQDGSIGVQVSGGSSPYQYLWSNGGTSAGLQNLACGQYFLTLTDSVGCIKSYSVSLDCPQAISIISVVPQNILCFGGSNGAISVQAQGGSGALSYLWDDPNAQVSSTAQNLFAGNYNVTVTDGNGCNITTSSNVTQPPLLAASTVQTNATCLNFGDGTATANPTGGVLPYSYSWGASGTTQTITNLAAGTFFVTVTDANQCTATASATIGQPTTAVMVTATQTRFACYGESNGDAAVSASGSNGAPFNFIWSNGQVGGGASNLAVGLYTVTATDAKGCTGTQIVVIQELDSIHVLTVYGSPTCNGYSDGVVAVVLVEGGLGMGDSTQYNYQWSLPGAPNLTVVAGFKAGDYTLTVTDLQGCTGIHYFEVGTPDAVSLQLAVEDVSCYGFADGSVSVTAVQNAVGAVDYQWSNAETSQTNEDIPMGSYSVTATDSKGCTATAVADVQQPEPLDLNFQVQPLICADDSNAVVTAIVTGGTSAYNFLWDNGATTAGIQGLGPGNYVLQVTDQNGCIMVDSVEVSQPGALSVSVETIAPECFGGLDGRIRLLVSGGETPYRYSINGGPFGGGSAFLALGAGSYQLQVHDANGCLISTTAVLNQPAPVQVSVGLDTTLILGDSLLLSTTVNNAVGITSFEWGSALLDNFTCASLPDCEEIWIKPGFSNTYRVKVTDENGCMGEDEIRIKVEKPRGVYVPTGFTPNGDFENDLLVVHGKSLQVHKVLTFKVFDRWGEMVYEDYNFSVNDTSRGWDGTFRGQPCDPAVFVWLLEAEYVDGFIELLKGNVTLVR